MKKRSMKIKIYDTLSKEKVGLNNMPRTTKWANMSPISNTPSETLSSMRK